MSKLFLTVQCKVLGPDLLNAPPTLLWGWRFLISLYGFPSDLTGQDQRLSLVLHLFLQC